jgi:stage IV sporulation protein FB
VFGQLGETQFDVRFALFGVPIRIHPVFWLSSAFLGWVPERIDLTLIHIVCILVAILVHELGHALMNARFGFRSEIVLAFLGGYATSMRHSTWKDVAVSAAGPAAGFLLLAAIYLPFRAIGFIDTWTIPITFRHVDAGVAVGWPEYLQPGAPGFELLASAVVFSVFINLIWNVMNLVPVLPLDGGQISRELFLWRYRQRRIGMTYCLRTSMVVGGAIALYALYQQNRGGAVLGLDPMFLALMFGYLAFQSYQQLELHERGY